MLKIHSNENLLSSAQYGLRPINQVTEFFKAKIDLDNTGEACFMDLKERFDKTEHGVFIIKLN